MNLSDDQKLMLFALGTADELRELGLLKDGGMRLEPGGKALFRQLKSQGYRPTREELREAVAFLKSTGELPGPTEFGLLMDQAADTPISPNDN